MSERTRPPSRRQLAAGCAAFFVLGAAALAYLNGSGLTSPSKFHTDLTQSPHWIAHHGDEFAPDDLLVEYGRFNESPIQNAIYWAGTWFIDVVILEKLVGIAIFGLTAALFFGLVSSMSGTRTGVLAAFFYIIFPRATYETGGGFSKAWAIGLVLLAVYVIETRSWRVLLWAMPFAALAYPMASVLMGAIVAIGIALEAMSSRGEAVRGLKPLIAGSALALVPLLHKYLNPPGRIGEMISTERMKQMFETGESASITIPLWEEVLSYFDHAFFVYALILLSMLLYRRGLVWKRSWTAVVIASTILYYIADSVMPRLYVPDRYSRYSVAVLLVLWFSHNWARVFAALTNRWVHRAAVVALVSVAAHSFDETFRPCEGKKAQGLWEDRGRSVELSRAVAAQPSPVLVAGHPQYQSEVQVLARRPVLVVARMYHAWYDEYREEIRQRILACFSALYAKDVRYVNILAERYGVTHLIVRKQHYKGWQVRTGRLWRKEFYDFIAKKYLSGRGRFVLDPPPRRAIVFEDDNFWLVRLPLEVRGASGRVRRRVAE